MHLYFVTRGKKNEIDEFAKWMETRNLSMPVYKADGTSENMLIECQLRPVQLWEFVFPKENLDVVLNTLRLPSENPSEFRDGKSTFKMFDSKLFALRKMLGAEKIPEPNKDAGVMFMPFDRIKNINIMGIGIREDGDISEATHERI